MAAFGDFPYFTLWKIPKATPPLHQELLLQEFNIMSNTSAYHGHIERDFRENPIHDTVHVQEMHSIAAEEIKAQVPELARAQCAKLINEAVRAMIGALRFDIETSLEIAFKDLGAMYKDKRTRQFISDTICKTIEKRLSNITIKL